MSCAAEAGTQRSYKTLPSIAFFHKRALISDQRYVQTELFGDRSGGRIHAAGSERYDNAAGYGCGKRFLRAFGYLFVIVDQGVVNVDRDHFIVHDSSTPVLQIVLIITEGHGFENLDSRPSPQSSVSVEQPRRNLNVLIVFFFLKGLKLRKKSAIMLGR